MKRTLLDTNILIRLITNDDKFLVQKALKAIEGKIGVVTTPVFAETIFVLTSFYKYKHTDLIPLREFFSAADIEIEDGDINMRALQIFTESNLHYVDCWLLSRSKIDNISITTLDSQLKRATSR